MATIAVRVSETDPKAVAALQKELDAATAQLLEAQTHYENTVRRVLIGRWSTPPAPIKEETIPLPAVPAPTAKHRRRPPTRPPGYQAPHTRAMEERHKSDQALIVPILAAAPRLPAWDLTNRLNAAGHRLLGSRVYAAIQYMKKHGVISKQRAGAELGYVTVWTLTTKGRRLNAVLGQNEKAHEKVTDATTKVLRPVKRPVAADVSIALIARLLAANAGPMTRGDLVHASKGKLSESTTYKLLRRMHRTGQIVRVETGSTASKYWRLAA